MSQSPSLPERQQIELDPDMSEEERLAALEDHYVDVVEANRQLEASLDAAQERATRYQEQVDRLERENHTLKQASLFVATVEELTDDGLVIRQHGNNQEVLTEVTPDRFEQIEAGDRVAVNDSFAIKALLDNETDSRAQAMEIDTSPSVTYADIGGIESQIREVREAVEEPLSDPEQFKAVGIEPPAGVLLHGPPGTGKTMLAKAVANETDATFIKMAGSELVQKFIGEGARLVRDLFQLATEHEPAIIFIDEIDAIASKRTDSKTSGDAEVQRTMMQLLSEMDGFETRGDIKIMAATNRFDMLDRAILRPGRFDRLIEVPLPDIEGRKRIFEIHTQNVSLSPAVDFEVLANETDGYSGAEIASTCTEAGIFAIRDDRTTVEMADFEAALEKIDASGDGPGAVISSDGYADYVY